MEPQNNTRENLVTSAMVFFAAIMATLAVLGGIRSYYAIPYWDMWDGTVDFYFHLEDGDFSSLWSQQNEHRIVLSRLLFFIDYKWLAGQNWPLIIANYLLIVCEILLVLRIYDYRNEEAKNDGFSISVKSILVGWLLLWSQAENLTWAFQSQFILAQVVALVAFFLQHKSLGTPSNRWLFGAACFFGLLSVGTMANGILVLPIMTLLSISVRQSAIRTVTLVLLSCIEITLYFHNYTSPSQHGSLLNAIAGNPLGLVEYVLLYLGGPFYRLFAFLPLADVVGMLFGAILIGFSINAAWQIFRLGKAVTLEPALLAFILYIGGTALGTAGGRLIFGVQQALSERYQTPVLLCWAILFILYLPQVRMFFSNRKTISTGFVVVLCTAMLATQLQALFGSTQTVFEKQVTALALALGVHDSAQMRNSYPVPDRAYALSTRLKKENLSFFSAAPYRDLMLQSGKPLAQQPSRSCGGYLDAVASVDGDSNFYRLSGWLFDSENPQTDDLAWFIDSSGLVAGAALIGGDRPDVSTAVSTHASKSGFIGYLPVSTHGIVKVVVQKSNCQTIFDINAPVFRAETAPPATDPSVATTGQILQGSTWSGADFFHSTFPNMKVIGSFRNSDADMGFIIIHVHKGSRIYFRSGPTAGRQVMEILGSTANSVVMPISTEWSALDFIGTELPQGEFDVKFSDQGSGWGEWSAIAVRQEN